MNFDILVIDTKESFDNLKEYVSESSFSHVVLDTETDSVVERKANLYGLGLSFKDNEAFYIPFKDKQGNAIWSKEEYNSIRNWLTTLFSKSKLVGHNIIYDALVLKHSIGLDIVGSIYSDTILQKHTVDEERPFGLKEVAVKYLGDWADKAQLALFENIKANGGSTTKDKLEMYKADTDVLAEYCGYDVILTRKLFDIFERKLSEEGLYKFFYEEEVMPLYKEVTIPMRDRGLPIDLKYFQNLKAEVEGNISKLTANIFEHIKDDIEPLVVQVLEKKVKVSKTGKFAKKLLAEAGVAIPIDHKTGKPTLSKKALSSLPSNFATNWLLKDDPLTPNLILKIQREIYVEDNPDLPHVFNLNSNDHLAWLLFESYGKVPTEHSDKTGKPQVDKESIAQYADLPFVQLLLDLKKEEKLLNTYILPILETQIDGWLYPSMLQFGTISGRYSCAGGLNLQTLPRDDKRIKKGFISPSGYNIVNSDFSALEPRIFSWVSEDGGLKDVWNKGLDLYSQIAIDVFMLDGVSADEAASNYLKKVNPDARQKAKTFSLAVPYGSSASRIAELAKVDYQEAEMWIENYLTSYPKLKDYMERQEQEVIAKGVIRSKFGRVRHLSSAKNLYQQFKRKIFSKKLMRQYGEWGIERYYEFRNSLNNAKNFPIQSTAAHVCNAALIHMARALKENNIDGWICLQVHDEITCIVREDQADRAAELLQEAMENNRITKQIDIPIKAEPIIGNNLAESK